MFLGIRTRYPGTGRSLPLYFVLVKQKPCGSIAIEVIQVKQLVGPTNFRCRLIDVLPVLQRDTLWHESQ